MSLAVVKGIQPQQLDFIWEKAKKELARIETDGYLTDENIYTAIKNGEMQLWQCANLFIVTQIKTYPSGYKNAVILLCAGNNVDPVSVIIIEQLSQWAKQLGCNSLDIYGRRGWKKKLPQFEEKETHFNLH